MIVTVVSNVMGVREFTGVSAVGIGHIRKDAVLVFPPNADQPKEQCEELGTAWASLVIKKEPHE